MSKKVAIICTSADKLGDHSTGLWLEECAAPYNIFKEQGYDVEILSIRGGAVPVDAGSLAGDFYTAACKKFKEEDTEAWNKLQNTQAIDPATTVAQFDALFFAGGHGTVADFCTPGVLDCPVNSLVEKFYSTGKPLAAVCHGPMCLMEAKRPDGEPLVKGLNVTGFSDAEEVAVGMAGLVPYTPESQMKVLGANVSVADPFTANACRDGNLITGQNPQSSEATANLVVQALG
uniref:DJ-1/PfpI domain-containing protein n=1 Tax=Corethron hystrix TaxID=216773 RepID=A0A7S1BDT5_9STRA|mmetsp:Transcript_23664/g.53978  ORF Transcript_23664/g.53978 Transcript_23664/m.53978 type:complete len:232 (+) Transcript_23664:114-809(+)|eukprot:CAMPEP_0113321146 /NCGR_PEP_ID=MMETSP0010_2-20120614/14723_1 /TAXON_ID=216773 ORGANISM="Corethron hystrix, Strain 308" /NCGR_SAMPLE_ID=MMETSP0010_2 /ASSEMBLY_ACC=CAM_ASM_000155 /LENGTH=231 /DNA_ID=CAMNT_0000179173 /DNA_START=67 /DNA_END=762 /DNA_ORIENTATION=- /assembly_acc=CAM_ASM_000155